AGGGMGRVAVVVARPVVAHRARRDHDVAALDLGLERGGRAHTDEGLAAEHRQLLEGARGRATARPGRAARERDAADLARERPVLAVVGDAPRLVPVGGDQIDALGIARQEHVALHVAALAPDVVLQARVHLGPRRRRSPVGWRHALVSFLTTMAGIPAPKWRTGTSSDTSSSAQ